METLAGSFAKLQLEGQLQAKIGTTPVVVFWHQDRAWAIDDRCPHMGFPLHKGTVESGMVTCHWHHGRFDLESGCTLDPWADDARAYDVRIDGDGVFVAARASGDVIAHLESRLRDGLEESLALVTAKATLGLLAAGVAPARIVEIGLDFGVRYRDEGWGAGLTVLVAMANLLEQLDAADVGLALTHGLVFLARDTRGRAPRFPLDPLTGDLPDERLIEWYRRFIDTRSADAAERTLATALANGRDAACAERMMFAAVTDHVWIDVGHTLDFTNKAFESLDHVGAERALTVLPTLVDQTAAAQRSEELSAWRHPHDVGALIDRASAALPELLAAAPSQPAFDDVTKLAWQLLEDDPEAVMDALLGAIGSGASAEQLGRAVAFAAGLRITRFHVQNDHGDWDVVHHGFTTANALHQALVRQPTPELYRGLFHSAMRIYLDRFLNVPAARQPTATSATLAELAECWEVQGAVDAAGAAAYGFLMGGGSRRELVAALGHALLVEDAGFHWYQVVEAGASQAAAWPDGSEEQALILAGVARFLAAHTPTPRELSKVVTIAGRLRRGEKLFEEE